MRLTNVRCPVVDGWLSIAILSCTAFFFFFLHSMPWIILLKSSGTSSFHWYNSAWLAEPSLAGMCLGEITLLAHIAESCLAEASLMYLLEMCIFSELLQSILVLLAFALIVPLLFSFSLLMWWGTWWWRNRYAVYKENYYRSKSHKVCFLFIIIGYVFSYFVFFMLKRTSIFLQLDELFGRYSGLKHTKKLEIRLSQHGSNPILMMSER